MVLIVNVNKQLDELERLYRRLLAIIGWDDLARAETRPHAPPGFTLQAGIRRSLADDAWNAATAFIRFSEQIHATLQQRDLVCSFEEQHAWRSRLDRLQHQFAILQLESRF